MQTIQTPDGPAPDGTPWHVLREDYLAGHSARSLCVNYDVPMSTFRARAKREGWRRCDQPEPDPFSQPEPDDEPFDPDLLVIRARAHLRRAVTAGDALGALRWMKLVEQLTDFARRERGVRVRNAPDPRQAERDAIEAAYRRREAAETGTTRDISEAGGWSVDPDALSHPPDAPESNAGQSAVTGYVHDQLEQSQASFEGLDSLDSFFSAEELAANPELAGALKSLGALSPFLRDQARERATGP